MSTANRRGMGRGLAAILPQPGEVTGAGVPPRPARADPSEPRAAAPALRRRVDLVALPSRSRAPG